MYFTSTTTARIPFCNCVSSPSTMTTTMTCACTAGRSTYTYVISADYASVSDYAEATLRLRRRPRRPQRPPPDYVLPSLPAGRAPLTPWKGRDYMLRRKV